MTRFDNRDVAFDVPDGWEDMTVVAFHAPQAPGSVFATNVTLSRVERKPTATLPIYATQQIANLSSTLPNFELVSQRDVTFGGRPAVELFFHWRADEQAIAQRITIFERKGGVWSFAASALRDLYEQNLPGFDRIATTLKFGDEPAAPPTGNTAPPSLRGGDRGGLDKPRGW